MNKIVPDELKSFLGIIADVREQLDEASAAHTDEWRRAKKLKLHTAAAKLLDRCNRMEEEKRWDFLRAFTAYVNVMGPDWSGLDDMLDQAEAAPATDAPSDAAAEPEEEPLIPESHRLDAPSEVAAEAAEGTVIEGNAEVVPPPVEAEDAEVEIIEAEPPKPEDKDLKKAGTFYNQGYDAGFGGDENVCPYGARTTKGRQWKKGFEAGQRAREDEGVQDVDDTPKLAEVVSVDDDGMDIPQHLDRRANGGAGEAIPLDVA